MRVFVTVLDDLPLEDDGFRLLDLERRSLDVVGEVRLKEREILARYARRRGILDAFQCGLMERSEQRIEDFQPMRIVGTARSPRQGLLGGQDFRLVRTEQRADEVVQALELCVVTQRWGDFARVIAQLVEAFGAANHQNAVERRLEGRLRQHAITPTAAAGKVFQESPRIT